MTPWLERFNPLAKGAATLPAIVLVLLLRAPDAIVVAAAVFCAVAALMVLTGARLDRTRVTLLIVLPLIALLTSLSLAVWAQGATWMERWQVGGSTSLRLLTVLVLLLPAGFSTSGADLVRALVQQLRVPYRIGWTLLASFRFVPRFGLELATIRAAHRVRGSRKRVGYVVPLLAGGLRHAERVALAMDARGFGAHPTRTERHLVPWRWRDTVLLLGWWAGTAAVAVLVLR